MRRSAIALSVAFALLAARPMESASACAIVGADPSAAPRIKGEEALIVWDDARNIETFVRRANFEDARREFAFLVPTPTEPRLNEVRDVLFDRLASIYRSRRPESTTLRSRSAGVAGGGAGADSVTVIHEQRVGQLDATVLAATDATALASWLTTRGLASSDDLASWLAPYVAQRYFVTAFHYRPSADTTVRGTGVALTFEADQPFYPYSEPRSARRAAGRLLRVSVLAPWRVAALEGRRPWRARVGFAGERDDSWRGTDGVGDVQPDRMLSTPADFALRGVPRLGDHDWLTTFEDRPSRRGQGDVRFIRARDQRPVRSTIRTRIVPGD